MPTCASSGSRLAEGAARFKLRPSRMPRHGPDDDNGGNTEEQHSPEAPQPAEKQQQDEHGCRIHVGSPLVVTLVLILVLRLVRGVPGILRGDLALWTLIRVLR